MASAAAISSVSEASALVRRIAEPRDGIGESVKTAIVRAARRLGFSVSRTKDIWYQDARRIDSREMDWLRELATKREADALRARLLALRDDLAANNADLHRLTIDALERALRDMGHQVGTVAFREK